MSGVKGRSGGARANTGGTRPGAGRPKSDAVLKTGKAYEDPQAFLADVMNDATADARLRVDAAKALMPYRHEKKGEGGKKDEKKRAAVSAAQGRFAPSAPPKQVTNKLH